MSEFPQCPQCRSDLTYEDGAMYICPECAHEWAKDTPDNANVQEREVRDAYGNVLSDGDTVTVVKDLKVKGSSSVVKMGTKVKSIRLVEGDHDIDCRIDGIGAMKLKVRVREEGIGNGRRMFAPAAKTGASRAPVFLC